MSLGSFVQGAFQGYTFGESAKDRKKERERNEERFEWEREDQGWLGESRDRTRENWDYADTVRGRQRDQWSREDQQRAEQEAPQDELERIRDEGYEEWQRSQNGAPVPQNTPQGTVFVPLDTSRSTGEPVPSSPQATFPGLNVPGLSDRNPNAAPLRFGDDVPRMENRGIRVPLGSTYDDNIVGGMGDDMLLTDIQPVRGTYSEEEQREIERQARTMGMSPEQYVRSVTGEGRAPNVDRTDDARARRGTGRTGDTSALEPRRRASGPDTQRPAGGNTQDTTALTPNANDRRAVDYPYNPSSPESRAGIMQPGGERTAPRPPAETPNQPPFQNAMGPGMQAPQFAPLSPPAAPRSPQRAVSPDTVAAENASLTTRDGGPITYGGGAQPRPSTPGLPIDPRVPAGPEAGDPRLQDARNMRTALAADAPASAPAAAAPVTPQGQPQRVDTYFDGEYDVYPDGTVVKVGINGQPDQVVPDSEPYKAYALKWAARARGADPAASAAAAPEDFPNSAGFPEGSANGQFDVDDVDGVRRGVQTGSTTARPANPDTTNDARAARGTGRTSDPAPQPDAPVRDVDPERSAFVQDVQGLMRQGDISSAQNRIVQGLATGEFGPAGSPAARAIGAVGDYFTATPGEGQDNAAARRKTAEAIDWYQSDAARQMFEANPDLLAAAAADPIGFMEAQGGVAGPDPDTAPAPAGAASAAEPPRQPGQPTPAPTPAAQAGSGAGQPVYGGMTASQAAQYQDLPEPRMAIEDGGQPISIARESLASNVNADNQGQTPQVSEQQRAQGAATFREYYQTEVVPRQIEALYRSGDIEAAERLQTWLEDERSQGLQENYARAVHAASIGDERGFFDYLGKVYNSYDDGYRFIADESDLYKNEAGETVAKITLENTTTGERFTQEYEGGEELIQQVLTQMDPISVFEQLKGQAEAEAAAQAEQHAWEISESRRRIEEGFETPSDRRKVFSDAYKQLSETNPNWLRMSQEEKVIAVEDFLAQADTFATGGGAPSNAPVYLGD